jgi:hypothetical protein
MMRHCSRPGCNAAAAAAFNFDGLRRIVWLNPITETRDNSAGDLCRRHADRMTPPLHWELRDLRRSKTPKTAKPAPLVGTASGASARPAPETRLLARAFRAAG